MSPLPYDADTWPHYDDAFNYAGSDGNGGVKNGNFTLYWGVRPDPNAAASVFASNEADGWYAAWLNMSDMYRDCSRACDADNWTLVATKGNFEACETSFNVPEYQFVEMSEKGDAKKITLPEWKFGPITDAEPWVVDFSEGLDGELGMVTSLNGQGVAIPDPETGHWHDNVQIVWDDTAPTSAINASSGVDPKRGKYVAKLDTYVSYRGENESWVIDSTGGLVTGKQFVSGAFEITAKVPQSSGQVFAIWLFNGAKSWSAHVPYVSKENTSDKTCFAPSDGCTFFNMSSCVDASDPARCPFDPSLDEETCRNAGGAYVDKSTAPFTCLDNGRTPYQSYSGDPLWIDRLESPGNELPQLCKEFPNAEIDWEFPSNAPDTTRGPPFAPHSCEKPSSGGTPCDRTTKYNTSNINNYRFTDGSGEGTYTNIWVERSGGDFIDGQWHTYRIEVHTGTEGGCEPRVDYFFDGEYVGTNNAMVPRVAGRLWVLLMDRTTWSSGSGGWNGLLNTTGLNSSEALSIYSSVMVSEIRAEPFFEERDTYAPQPYDQPSMGVGYLADCGKKNPPTALDSSFVGYYTDDSSDRKIGNIKWIKRKED